MHTALLGKNVAIVFTRARRLSVADHGPTLTVCGVVGRVLVEDADQTMISVDHVLGSPERSLHGMLTYGGTRDEPSFSGEALRADLPFNHALPTLSIDETRLLSNAGPGIAPADERSAALDQMVRARATLRRVFCIPSDTFGF